ncbi:renalase isoform X3 [Misgurnus anguillicaudatus]|uniref:renalase isoform X3 n=1 Tax=Misgurnus anguillicaudatus TaxID=75329 RepID=UPI0024354FD8|nr:renalase isoform X3 [Misgurnus anguillicaudatus]
MSRVLIVGAGLTGSICACLLRRELPNKVNIVVWDKSRGAGGRMSTSRSQSNPSCTVDLGAQYISATPYYARIHSSFYEELLAQDILKPLVAPVEGMMLKDDGIVNYVTPRGVSSIVKHYLNKSAGAEVLYNRQVTHIYRKDAGWEVCPNEGTPEQFDIVVLTMPVPQILQLQGDVGSSSKDFGPSVVVHTSVPFGLQHLEEEKDEVQTVILKELEKVMPGLPQPESIKCQKWRYSQVTRSVVDCPGQMTLLSKPLLVCGGDGFMHSNFDGCIESALKVFEVLKSSL